MCRDILQPIFDDSNAVFMTTVNVPCTIKEPSPLKSSLTEIDRTSPTKRKADSISLAKRQRLDSGFEDFFLNS
jgi:hypothetical protein